MVIKLRSMYKSDLMQYFVVGMIISNFWANVVKFELMSAYPVVIQRFTDLDITFTIMFSVDFITHMISHEKYRRLKGLVASVGVCSIGCWPVR